MPYSNPKQATAVFLSIKREKGLAAAKRWAKKHSSEMAESVKARGPRTYRARSSR